MTAVNDLAKLVPGFEFLQGLMKSAGAGIPGVPGIGQWVAPTLNPEELEKRIQELKTVQFWLDSNAKLLGATIQALEVQRMTLSTLQSMNLPMADLREALKVKLPTVPAVWPPPSSSPAPAASDAAPQHSTQAAAAPPAIDPVQWWTALTRQFAELASNAVKDATPGTSAAAAKAARAAAKKAAAPRKRG